MPVLLKPLRLAFNYRSFLSIILSVNSLPFLDHTPVSHMFPVWQCSALLNVSFSLYHKLCYFPFKSLGVTLSPEKEVNGVYHSRSIIGVLELPFFLFSLLSSTRCKFFSFLLLYRFSFYHTFVNLVNSSSLLITHCNVLCSFHRTCTIF